MKSTFAAWLGINTFTVVYSVNWCWVTCQRDFLRVTCFLTSYTPFLTCYGIINKFTVNYAYCPIYISESMAMYKNCHSKIFLKFAMIHLHITPLGFTHIHNATSKVTMTTTAPCSTVYICIYACSQIPNYYISLEYHGNIMMTTDVCCMHVCMKTN